MAQVSPDPTFYRSARMAMEGPAEELAYVAILSDTEGRPDALGVVDVNPSSSTYGQLAGRLDLPNVGDELHHFGWNACSSCLCPATGHPHMERRYLLVPGLRSSRIHVVDTRPDPRSPTLVKVIEAERLAAKTGYSRPHTIHCGPDGIYVSALGSPEGEGPGGIFVVDHESLEPVEPWEVDRGPQYLAYDFWWHLGQDTMITSEWGTPNMVESGLNLDLLVKGEYGHQLHVWDLRQRRHLQALDLGSQHQMVLELRPSHEPNNTFGFVGVVVSTADLSASIWLWHRPNGQYAVEKVIDIPAEPADPDQLPDPLKPFSAVPPLVTDIDLSLDDRSLYVSCWGTGEFCRYDVSDPFHPEKTGSVRLGGIVSRGSHPAAGPLTGGPQMVEVSRDGRRVYVTNSLYGSGDPIFYPRGLQGWLVKLDADPGGGLSVDARFFLPFDGEKPHQVRLQGGDASSDSYCFPSLS